MTRLVVFALAVDEDDCVVSVSRVTPLDDAALVDWRECDTFDDLDLLETAVRVARAQRAGTVA